MTELTRRYRFSASHRLHAPVLNDETNQRLFGKCNNPYGHGHDYVLSVGVMGPVSRSTGLIVNLAALDELVNRKVISRFSRRNLNIDLPEFEKLVPTTENIVVVISGILEEHWADYLGYWTELVLRAVHLQETDRNGFSLDLQARRSGPVLLRMKESITADV